MGDLVFSTHLINKHRKSKRVLQKASNIKLAAINYTYIMDWQGKFWARALIIQEADIVSQSNNTSYGKTSSHKMYQDNIS